MIPILILAMSLAMGTALGADPARRGADSAVAVPVAPAVHAPNPSGPGPAPQQPRADVGPGPPSPPPGPEEPESLREPPPAAETADGPGSEAILRACWTSAQLAGDPSERTSRRGLKPDRAPPPAEAMAAARAAAWPLPAGLRGSIRQVEPADPQARLLALTFDLCEQANERSGYDAGVVDWLRAHRVKATFFAGGKWMRTHPERTMQLMADPLFEVGNHAWTHGNLRVIAGDEARDQILMAQAEYRVLRQALHERPCAAAADPAQWQRIPIWPTLFRFPYGTCSPATLAAAADLGLASIQWNLVTGDPDGSRGAEAIARGVRAEVKRHRGSIVVAHANGRGRHTAEALPLFVPQLRAEGYRFVTVSELLGAGRALAAEACYEVRPGDNLRYDKQFGRGTGE